MYQPRNNRTSDRPKPKAKPQYPESKLQQACVKWFRYQYPNLVLYANPNGGKRSGNEAAIMNGEGVLSGIPDLFLAAPRGNWHGLYIEMKIQPNVPTLAQTACMAMLVKQGYCCQVCYTFEQFMMIVNDYLRLPKPNQ